MKQQICPLIFQSLSTQSYPFSSSYLFLAIVGSFEEVEGSLGQYFRCSENIKEIDEKGNNLQLISVYKDACHTFFILFLD